MKKMIRLPPAPIWVDVDTGNVQISLDSPGKGWTIPETIKMIELNIQELKDIQKSIDQQEYEKQQELREKQKQRSKEWWSSNIEKVVDLIENGRIVIVKLRGTRDNGYRKIISISKFRDEISGFQMALIRRFPESRVRIMRTHNTTTNGVNKITHVLVSPERGDFYEQIPIKEFVEKWR